MGDDRLMQYWLMKSEPKAYSIDDLKRDKRTMWDGVRNYQARNFMWREMKVGDRALFYHSNTTVIGVYGVIEIASKPYPDPTQFDRRDSHFDEQATKEKPRWYLVDVAFVKKFAEPISLSELKNDPFFDDMVVTQKGSRLSVQPVKEHHFKRILKMTEHT
jgi:predicted RNA-binding protein with PUA-like domain